MDRGLIWSTLARRGKKDKNGRQEHLRGFTALRSRKQRQLQRLNLVPENLFAAGLMVRDTHHKSPVDSASVYVKFVQARMLGKDKKIEMNLKTNLSGVCHVPEIPRGRFLVQVIAPGWKTFGEYYEVDQAEQTINIELARPPKWY